MTQNIEQRTKLAVDQYEGASGTINKFAHANEVINTTAGVFKSFPKISKEWDSNATELQKEWSGDAAALTIDWKLERDALSIKALPVKLWVIGELETDLNQQRRFTDGHTYLPKIIPALMTTTPDNNWFPFTADKIDVLSNVFGSAPIELMIGLVIKPVHFQYPKLGAFGQIYELSDGSLVHTIKSFVQSVDRQCVITMVDDTVVIAMRADAATQQYVHSTVRHNLAVSMADINGKDWFVENGFNVTSHPIAKSVSIAPGVGYVSGVRVEQSNEHIIEVETYPQFVYIDAWFDGIAKSTWISKVKFTVSNRSIDDYIDPIGIQHYVCKLAEIKSPLEVIDLRKQSDLIRGWKRGSYVRRPYEVIRFFGDNSLPMEVIAPTASEKKPVLMGDTPIGDHNFKIVDDAKNVTKYGAKTDGVTDALPAIHLAMVGGGRVYLPPGRFFVSDTIRVPSNTTLFGAGIDETIIIVSESLEGTKDVIVNASYQGEVMKYDSGILLHDFSVHANGFARQRNDENLYVEWGRAIRLSAVHDSAIKRVRAIEGPQHCIDITNWNDEYVGKGHGSESTLVGMSYNITIRDVEVIDYCYDDGLTTHACRNITIDNVTAKITDEAKSKNIYVSTQNGIEIDDGSSFVTVTNCKTFGNNTLSKGMSVATHPHAPAVHDIVFRDCYAHGTNIGFNAWADINTNANFNTVNWLCKNILFENCTHEKPFLREDSNIFPSRPLDVQGFTDVKSSGLNIYMKDKNGSYSAPVGVINLANVARCEIAKTRINKVLTDFRGIHGISRRGSWLRIAQNCSRVKVQDLFIDNIGYFERIITDSASSALITVDGLVCSSAVADGIERFGVVSGALAEFKNVEVPDSVVPYKIGAAYKEYGNCDIKHNRDKREVILGGIELISETTSEGKQAKSGICFDNQFMDQGGVYGKGSISFKTSTEKPRGFSVSAELEDEGHHYPIFSAWAKQTSDSSFQAQFEPGKDNEIYLGTYERRWKQIYVATSPIATSDERAKKQLVFDDKIFEAWEKIEFKAYQFKDAIDIKGESARIHVGYIAQEIVAAFNAVGLDAFRYGLLCYDEWDAEYTRDLVMDESGEMVEVSVKIKDAGNSFGVRYEEALAMECAYQRNKIKKMEYKLSQFN